MVQDRLVVGITDKMFSQWLQMEPEITLDKTKWLVWQKEAVKEQGTVSKE